METPVIESKKQSTVRGSFRINAVDSRNLPRNCIQDAFKSVWVLTLHKLNDVANIVPVDIQVPLRASQRQTAGSIWSKVAQVPPLNKLSKRRYPRMLLQGSERRDAEFALVLKLNKFPFGAFLIF